MVEFENQPVNPDRHQDQRDIRIADHRQEFRFPVRFEFDNRRAFGRQRDRRAVFKLDGFAVYFFQQLGAAMRDQVDNVFLQRFAGGNAFGFSHSLFAPFGIAAAQFGQPADKGCRILDRLVVQGGGVGVR